MDYVTYYRVSTRRQGKSGLGLEAQRTTIRAFLRPGDTVIGEFTDIVSGRDDHREQLNQAVILARKRAASLLIAKLDRFSRRVSFIAAMMEGGIKLTVAEMPNATDFQLHIFAALAQEERRVISERTRLALQAAKLRGRRLGQNGQSLATANRVAADEFALGTARHLPQDWEHRSLTELAAHLNAKGLRTRGGRQFYPQTVKNILARL